MTDEQYETLIAVDTKVTAILLIQTDHEGRLRKLERFRNWAAGVGAAVVAFFTYIFTPAPH